MYSSDKLSSVLLSLQRGTAKRQPAQAIADAVAKGRAGAAELRTLTGTFEKCGFEVVGYEPASGGYPYIVAQPTGATIARVMADVGACVERWIDASGPGSHLAKKGGVAVNLVPPAVAERRVTGKESWPTAMRMSSPKLPASPAERPHPAVSFLLSGGGSPRAGPMSRGPEV